MQCILKPSDEVTSNYLQGHKINALLVGRSIYEVINISNDRWYVGKAIKIRFYLPINFNCNATGNYCENNRTDKAVLFNSICCL